MIFKKALLVFHQFFYIAGAFRLILIYIGHVTCSILEALCLVLMPIAISRFLQGASFELQNNTSGFLDTFNASQVSIALIVISCIFAALKFFLARLSVKYSENLAATLTLDVSRYLFCQSSIRSEDDRGNDSKDKLLNSILSCIPDVFRSAFWSSIDLVTSSSFLVVVFVICSRIFGLTASLGVFLLVIFLFSLVNIPAKRVKTNNALINDLKSHLISNILISASGYREINYSNSFDYYQSTLRSSVLSLRRIESANLQVVQYLTSLTSAFPFLLISLVLLMPVSLGVPIDAAVFLVFSIQRLIPSFSRFSSSYIKFFSTASSVNTLYTLVCSLQVTSSTLFTMDPRTTDRETTLKTINIPETLESIFLDSLAQVNLLSDTANPDRYIFSSKKLVQLTGPSGLGKSYLLDTFSSNIVANPVSRQIPFFYLPNNFVVSGTTCQEFLFLFSPPVSTKTLLPYLLGFRLINHASELDSLLSRHPSILSSGQATRLAVIRALLTNPRVFLIDESLSTLNVEIEFCVLNTIFKLHPTITIASVTHRPIHITAEIDFHIMNLELHK